MGGPSRIYTGLYRQGTAAAERRGSMQHTYVRVCMWETIWLLDMEFLPHCRGEWTTECGGRGRGREWEMKPVISALLPGDLAFMSPPHPPGSE